MEPLGLHAPRVLGLGSQSRQSTAGIRALIFCQVPCHPNSKPMVAVWSRNLKSWHLKTETKASKETHRANNAQCFSGMYVEITRRRAEDITASFAGCIWEFPRIRGTLFGGPYNKDPTI